MSDEGKIISDNYGRIRQRAHDAASRSGRSPSAVTLVAVTKYVGVEQMKPLIEAGCCDLGESRPQALWEKVGQLPDDVRWHLIGHLQRNKVARTLPLVDFIHSLDSLRLIEAIRGSLGENLESGCQFLLEVNISGESGKHGFSPEQLPDAFELLARYANIRVVGLMGMSAFNSSADQTRRQFALLRTLRDEWEQRTADNILLRELSMGMSGDFEIAIEEGATMVRVGSALFEGCAS